MSLVSCFATPHPPAMVPAVARERLTDVQKTVDAMRRLAAEVRAMAPDVILLMSPHAPLAADRMGVSLASWYEGSFAVFGAPEVHLRLSGAPDLAQALIEESEARGVPARGLQEGRGAELDHGALAPLALLLEDLAPQPALIVLGFSYLAADAHVEFGRAVASVLNADPRRALYIASGDLSHRLIPGAPAGFSPVGKEFDGAVVRAFEADDLASLRSLPSDLVQSAGECGLRSLITLSGVIEGLPHETRLLSYEGPFGVGYMVGAVDLLEPSGEARKVSADAEESPRADVSEEDPFVALARRAVEAVVIEGRQISPDGVETGPVDAESPGPAGVFVSLHMPDGSLRGCIGTFAPSRPTVAAEVVSSAVGAATRDPRFFPVRPDELAGMHVSVDVLQAPEDVEGLDELDPRSYGVIVSTDDGRQGLLLPDLEGVDTAERQLEIACQKGRIDPLRDRYRIQRFRVTRHGRH
jgi:AmmeMemoRadiSam system protein A